MAGARVKRVATQTTLLSDPFGLLTRVTRWKKPDVAEEVEVFTKYGSNLPSSFVPPPAKKPKLLTGMVSSIDQVVINVIQETGQGSHQSRSGPEFKFWENCSGWLMFLYDNLNVEGDVTKAKCCDCACFV